MAEVHFIGSILGGSDFPLSFGNGLCCIWQIISEEEESWQILEGNDSGSTHVDIPRDKFVVWSHPIDIHYSTKSIQGWPKLVFQVFKQDSWGRYELECVVSYGYTSFPMSPGLHEFECITWKPIAGIREQWNSRKDIDWFNVKAGSMGCRYS